MTIRRVGGEGRKGWRGDARRAAVPHYISMQNVIFSVLSIWPVSITNGSSHFNISSTNYKFGFISNCASFTSPQPAPSCWLLVLSYCKEPSLSRNLRNLCHHDVFPLARVSVRYFGRSLVPRGFNHRCFGNENQLASAEPPSSHTSPSRALRPSVHAHRCRCFRDGRSTFPFHTDSRLALDKSHPSDRHSRTFYHSTKIVTN